MEDGTFFTSEIFATGLALMGALVLIAVPAYFRSKIPYELFYGLHHIFVPLYAIGIAHTLDPKGRNEFSSRMQVILWTTAPILIYSFDRTMRNFDLKEVALTSFKLTTSPRAALLRMPAPAGLDFLVGQYVKICVPAVSTYEYHPFTIATSPRSGKIELIVRVVDGGGASWTERLYAHLASLNSSGDQRDVKVILEGPYGHVMTGVFEVPNTALIASGSGIVPMLSVLRDLLLSEKYALRVSNATPATPRPQASAPPRPAGPPAAAGKALNISTVYVPARAPAMSKKREVRRETSRRLIQAKQTFYLGPTTGGEIAAAAAAAAAAASHSEVSLVVEEEAGDIEASEATPVAAPPAALQPGQRQSKRKEHLTPRALLNVMSPPVDILSSFMDSRKRLHTYWLAATHGWFFFFFSMLLGVLQILCIGLEVSWSHSELGNEPFPPQYTWPFRALDIISAVAIALSAAVLALQPIVMAEGASSIRGVLALALGRARASVRRTVNSLTRRAIYQPQEPAGGDDSNASRVGSVTLHLCALLAQAVLLAHFWGRPRFGEPFVLGAFLLLRAYLAVLHYCTNPLFLVHSAEDAAAHRLQAAFMTSTRLLWTLRTPDLFECVFEELAAIVEDMHESMGEAYVSARIFITQASPQERALVEELVAGSALEGCLVFARPNFGAELGAACQSLAAGTASDGGGGGGGGGGGPEGHGDAPLPAGVARGEAADVLASSLSVFVCGAPAVASDVREAVLGLRAVYSRRLAVTLGMETVFG